MVSMPKPTRLNKFSSGFALGLVERETTPELTVKLGIQLYAAGLSLADTESGLAGWMLIDVGAPPQLGTETGLQPVSGKSPNHVAVNETVNSTQ